MTPQQLLAAIIDPTRILAAQGLTPDPWQRELLYSSNRNILLNCCRGAGKSRTTSALALHTALFTPKALVLLISRSQRQAGELFRYVKQGFSAIGRPIHAIKETETQLELANGSRIVCLPGKEETIRSFQGVHLLVLDEAARIPDDLLASVSPMTGVSKGRTIALSTPFGQRGWLWKEWQNERADYTLAESRLYRYPSASERGAVGENPVDQDNHAMAALRYCITRLDELPSTLADYDFPVTDFLLEAVLPLRGLPQPHRAAPPAPPIEQPADNTHVPAIDC